MKQLKEIIQEKLNTDSGIFLEKLRLGKDTNVKEYLTFDEFTKLVSKEIETKITNKDFEILTGDGYLGNVKYLKHLRFINITDNKEEMNYYQHDIIIHKPHDFNLFYVINEGKNGLFINYINTKKIIETDNIHSQNNIIGYRYAYIIGKDYKNISNVYIFEFKK